MATHAGYIAGSSGRFKSIVVAPDYNQDGITFTGTPATRNEIVSWELMFDGQPVTSLTLESLCSSQGRPNPVQLRGGSESWSVNISGQFDATLTTGTYPMFKNGIAATTRLVLKKNVSTGADIVYFDNAYGVILGFRLTGINPQTGLQMFSCTLHGSGVFPDITYAAF